MSTWAYRGHTGRMVYQPDNQGDRIPDFSNVGYRAGKAPIPTVPVQVTVSAGPGDDTARIQAALDQVAEAAGRTTCARWGDARRRESV